MIDLRHAFRQPVPRAAALMGAALTVLALVAAGARLADRPAPGPAPIPPEMWFASLIEPARPLTRLATDDEIALPRAAAARPQPVGAAPAVMAEAPEPRAPRTALVADEVPLPVARAAAPLSAPVARADSPAPAPLEQLASLALPADGPAAMDMALGTVPRGLTRSPVPPARPRRAERPAPSDTVALRIAAPPARPAAVARLAAAPAALAPLATAALAPADPAPRARIGGDGCGPALARAIPRRPSGAADGRAVLAGLSHAGGGARDAALVRAVEGGNIPDHLRALVPVAMTGTQPDGRRATVTLCVMPDYLAVGSDADFVRIPLGLPAANRLAERFDMILPTARMVDAIHAQAQVRLAPSPMTPGSQMASTAYLLTHNATVEAQRRATGAALGHLVSGHKKDLVLTNRLTRVAGRVAIYGWHRANGRPIQPLSTVHGAGYADYSHGVRLVSRTAFVNGRAVDLLDLLADRRYAAILSGDEGPIATRQILAALR